MVRKRKLKVKDSDNDTAVDVVEDDDISIDQPQDIGTVVVAAHVHKGVLYKSGDVIAFDDPASARKLRARGSIS